jgi:hypothetical protein
MAAKPADPEAVTAPLSLPPLVEEEVGDVVLATFRGTRYCGVIAHGDKEVISENQPQVTSTKLLTSALEFLKKTGLRPVRRAAVASRWRAQLGAPASGFTASRSFNSMLSLGIQNNRGLTPRSSSGCVSYPEAVGSPRLAGDSMAALRLRQPRISSSGIT